MRWDRLTSAFCLASVLGLAGLTQAQGQPICRPKLELQNVKFSEMQPKTLQRKWTARVAVDASGCAANASGSFDLRFTRLLEVGLDADVHERLAWRPPSVDVELDFWADEAIERYAIANVSTCPCAKK